MVEQAELNLKEGKKLRDRGIETSGKHAESKNWGWREAALEFVRNMPNVEFMTENVRQFAYLNGLPRPPSERAWGSVIARARKLKIIQHHGYRSVDNPKAHRTPASVWKKVVI